MQLFTAFIIATGLFTRAFAVPVETALNGGGGFNGIVDAREEASGATVMNGGAGFN
ncbi:hypothetical protein MY4824_006821 [Beauveria thailandica]